MTEESEEQIEPTEPPQEPEQTPAEPTEVEIEARKYGWRPKEDFDRDPDNWVDAEKFMSFPTTQTRVLKDEVNRVKASIDETVATRVGAVETMLKQAQDQELQRQKDSYDRQIAEIRSQQRDAVRDGDVQAYDRLKQQEGNLQAPTQPQAPDPNQAVVDKFRSENKWTQDPIMWAAAVNAVGNNQAGLNVEQQLQLAEASVRSMFPDKFEAPKPPRQKVDSGGLGGAGKKTKGFSDLPAEARKQGAEFVEDGIFENKEAYAKAYWAQMEGA